MLRGTPNSDISWIGSTRAFAMLGSPIFFGPLFDRGHPRLIALGGSFLVVFGMMMTSLCSSLWQLILAQGICVGLGGGALFLTSVAIVPSYFTAKKSWAMGIAAGGSSLGGIVYPVMFYKLQPMLGFGWSVRIMGFLALATSAVSCATVRMRAKPQSRRAMFDRTLLLERSFQSWCLAYFFAMVALYIPFFYIQEYSTEVSAVSRTLAFWTLPVMNAGSLFGRLIAGKIADAIKSPILTIVGFTLVTTVLAFCWIAVMQSVPGLYVFSALYGACSGAFVSLSTPATVDLAPNLALIGTRLGLFNLIGAFGLLAGNPIAGAIIKHSWIGGQAFCGAVAMLALLLSLVVWLRTR